MVIAEKIESLLAEKFREDEFADCFLIEIKQTGRKLEVFIDSDSGVTFETCQRISRFLEQHIDEGGWLGENYILEVSSPGVSRPLMLKRQYPRNIGRLLEITLTDDPQPRSGTLLSVGDEHITIEETIKRKEGKKNITERVQTTIPFETIKKSLVKITF